MVLNHYNIWYTLSEYAFRILFIYNQKNRLEINDSTNIVAKNTTGQTNCTKNPDFENPLRRKAIEAATVKAVSTGIHK